MQLFPHMQKTDVITKKKKNSEFLPLKCFIPILLTSSLWEYNYEATGVFQKKCEYQLRIMVRSCLWKFILLLSLLSYRVTPAHALVLGMKTLRKMWESLFCLLSWTNKCKDTTIFQNRLVRIWWNLAKFLSISHFNHWKPET